MAPITKKRHILESFNSFNGGSSQFNSNSVDLKDSPQSSLPYSSKSPVIVSPVSVSLPVIQPPLQSSKLTEFSLSNQVNHSVSNVIHYNENNNLTTISLASLASDDSKHSIHSLAPSPLSSSALSPQYARVNRVVLDKNSDEYRKRRERNNIAVKKSRTKSKLKNAETMKKVNELKHENEMLRSKVNCLATELQLLKNVLAAHASSAHGAHLSEFDIKLLTSSEALSLASPTTSPVPSPPIVPVFGQSKHHHSHSHHLTSASYDPLQASLVPGSSFRDSLIRESIIHRNRINSSPSSASSSSSMSPIMSPASPHSLLESFYMSNVGSLHPSSSVTSGHGFGQNRRMSPVTSLNSFNSRSSLNDSEDDF